MSSFPSVRFAVSRLVRRVAKIESRVREFRDRTSSRRGILRACSYVLFAGMSLVLMADNGCGGCEESILFVHPPQSLVVKHRSQLSAQPSTAAAQDLSVATPMLTGVDGSTTGTASFLGNFTALAQPSGSYFVLGRQKDCSLTMVAATASLQGSATVTGEYANYERTLHQLASLKTTADVFPHGCAETGGVGVSSRPGVWVGTTQGGYKVFALAEGDGNQNAVFVLSSSADYSKVTFTPQTTLSAATALATADLNGDGNGDLIVVNGYGASSAFVSVMLGNSDGTFQSPVNYPIAGNYSTTAVIDDVNGDGKLDVVAVSQDQQISVLLGKGDGTLQSAQSFAAPALPGYTGTTSATIAGMITTDLRGIGKKDIVCSNGLVLLGNGDGTFTAASAAAFPFTQDSTYSGGPTLASGDLNNDGKLDLVMNNGLTVSTWLGKGDGTFTQGQSYAAIYDSGFVTVSDLDGDGNADIYVGLANGGLYSGDDSSFNSAYVLMGNGDGTFQGALQLGFGNYTGTNLGDVTGSGKLDLITNTVNTPTGYPTTGVPEFTVQLGNGNGAFTPASTIALPASIVVNGYTLTVPSTGHASSSAVADINGDGKADLVLIESDLTGTTPGGLQYQYSYPVYFTSISNGDGTFKTPVPTAFPQIAPAGDFDNAVSLSGMRVTSLKKGGPAAMIASYYETAGASYGGPAVNPYSDGFVVLPGNGDGTFNAPVLTTSYSGTTAPNTLYLPQILGTADFNGDGSTDLLVLTNTYTPATHVTNSQLQVYLGKGDGTFQTPTTVGTVPNMQPGPFPAPCVVADLNKDSVVDIACLGADASGQTQLGISLGKGDGTFGAPSILNLTSGVAQNNGGVAGTVTAADFDDDGNVDLAVLLGFYSRSGIFYGKGDGTFTSVNVGTTAAPQLAPKDLLNIGASYIGSTVAVDLSGDGKPDILTGNTILLNMYGSSPTVTAASATALAVSATSVTAGASVTLTATVTGATGSTASPSGTVTFMNGTTALGTGTLSSGVATYSTTALPVGAQSITAVYSGDANFSSSTSPAVTITVNSGPALVATATALSVSASTATTGASVVFTATVTPASGTATPAGTVTFSDGTTSIGTGTLNASGTATLTTTSLAVGSHSIVAAYGGSTTFATSNSSAVAVAITAPLPDFSLSLSPASGTVTSTNHANATVTVTPSNGFTGAVSFACTGQPSTVTCSFSPATFTVAGQAQTTTVTFANSGAALAQPLGSKSGAPLMLAALGFGFWLAGRTRKHSRLFSAVAVLAFVLAGVAGCGGGRSHKTQTTSVTITATSGSESHTATYSLTSSN